MVRDVRIKRKRMDTRPWLDPRPRSPFQCPGCGLTNPPDRCMLESECIFNVPSLFVFVANFIEIDWVFFSPAIRTDGQTCSETEKNNILWPNTNKPYVFLGFSRLSRQPIEIEMIYSWSGFNSAQFEYPLRLITNEMDFFRFPKIFQRFGQKRPLHFILSKYFEKFGKGIFF